MQQRVIYPDEEKWTEIRNYCGKRKSYIIGLMLMISQLSGKCTYIHISTVCGQISSFLHPKFGIAVYEFIKESNLTTIKESFEKKSKQFTTLLKRLNFMKKNYWSFFCPRLGAMYGAQYSSSITVGLIFTNIYRHKLRD